MSAYAVNVEQHGARFRATVDRSGAVYERGFGSGYTEREAIRKAWTDFWRANG